MAIDNLKWRDKTFLVPILCLKELTNRLKVNLEMFLLYLQDKILSPIDFSRARSISKSLNKKAAN